MPVSLNGQVAFSGSGGTTSSPTSLTSIGATFPITVPIDYCGVSFNRWPEGNPLSPSPTAVNYKITRNHDSSNISSWYQLEASQGVYTWSHLDTWVTANRANGSNVMFSVYGTPTFYTSSNTRDVYTALGGKSFPDLDTNLNSLKAFITAVITRYNSAGGVWRLANPLLGKGIQYVESWNEPDSSQFWDGTMSQLVDISNAINTAVQAVDPTVTVLSPAWSVAPNVSFYTTVGTLTGKTGAQSCSATAYHVYGLDLGSSSVNGNNNIFKCQYSPLLVKASLAQVGVNHNLYITEIGAPYSGAFGLNASNWVASSPSARKAQMLRLMMLLAAMGIKQVCWYSYDTSLVYPYDGITLFGMPNDPVGSLSALSEINLMVAGKTIINCYYTLPFFVTLCFSDGSSYTV